MLLDALECGLNLHLGQWLWLGLRNVPAVNNHRAVNSQQGDIGNFVAYIEVDQVLQMNDLCRPFCFLIVTLVIICFVIICFYVSYNPLLFKVKNTIDS